MTTYTDQYYQDISGNLHWLSALDQANAKALDMPLPDSSWTAITPAQAAVLQAPTAEQVIFAAASTAVAGGLAVTSTSTSALNGTYAVDSNTTAEINAEITSVLLNGVFTDGTTSLAWPDLSGAMHTFNIAQFKALATAIAAFITGVSKYARGQIGTLPSSSVTIA